jgi:hypothetical protein
MEVILLILSTVKIGILVIGALSFLFMVGVLLVFICDELQKRRHYRLRMRQQKSYEKEQELRAKRRREREDFFNEVQEIMRNDATR